MAIAVNDAGDVLSDAGGAWKPAVRATNDATGESLVLDGGAWKPMPGGKAEAAPDSSTTDMTPQQMYGGSSPTPDDATAGNRTVADDPGSRITAAGVKGAVEGFGNPVGQTILSPKAQDWMDARQREGGVGGFLAGLGSTAAQDIGTVGGVIAGVPSALFRGAQGAVAQTGAELGAPQLGRDIAAIPEAYMGEAGGLPHPTNAMEVARLTGLPIMEAWRRAHAQNAAAAIGDIGKAPDIDSAIAAAGKAAAAPAGLVAPESLAGGADLFGGGSGGDTAAPANVMTLPSGGKVPFTWKVGEAADLIPASGDLQPRDRAGRVASSGQVFNMANNLDPELLNASPGPEQGAPTVNADGVVLAGNGRTAAIRQAYAMGNGDPYRAMVERHGFDTSGMDEPVLYRGIDQMSPDQARQFAIESNTPTGQRLSGTEQAAIDARSLTPDLLAHYNPALTGGPTAAGNRGFVRAWVATLPQSERNAVMGSDGAISADGVRRLSGAMLSVAYDDKGTLSRSLESTDDNARALTGALTDAAPAWAQLQGEIAAGRVPPEMNVAPQLTRAVDLVRQARERGQTVGDVLAQSDAFNQLDPVTEGFLRAFSNPTLTRTASRSAVADVLRRYATEAAKTSTDAGLFGDQQPAVAPSDILATVSGVARTEAPGVSSSQVSQAPPTAPQGLATSPVTGMVQPDQPQRALVPVNPIPELQPAGAAITPDDAFGRTAREIRGQKADMELADLMRTPQPGDARDIIPGAAQTKAEIEQSPSLSREAKGLRMEFREGFNEDEKANNELYHQWIDQVTPSFENVGTIGDTRETTWKADEKRVFGADPNGPPVSTEPLVQHLEGIFNDPVQKYNTRLRKEFQPFVDALTDGNGDPIVLGAHELYGIRQEMNRTVKAMAGNPELALLRNEFGTLLKLTDSVIMSGAPAYREMMNNYREASKLINAGQRLAEGALKITNGSDRVITFGKFDAFMKNLWLERNGPNAYAPAKDIPQATWDHLMLLHERLARSASDQELARTRGSDTTQLMMEMGRKGLLGAAGVALAPVTHGLSTVAVPFISKQMTRSRNLKLVEQHRHPDLSQYPTPGP